jgi:hypothetical protein
MAEVNVAYQALMKFAAMDVVYGTKGWSNRDRADFTEELLDAGVPHEWNGSEVTVAGQYEKVVDQILARRH